MEVHPIQTLSWKLQGSYPQYDISHVRGKCWNPPGKTMTRSGHWQNYSFSQQAAPSLSSNSSRKKKEREREKSLVWECTKLIIPHDNFPSLLSLFLDPPHTWGLKLVLVLYHMYNKFMTSGKHWTSFICANWLQQGCQERILTWKTNHSFSYLITNWMLKEIQYVHFIRQLHSKSLPGN